jgi:hypothetical protein
MNKNGLGGSQIAVAMAILFFHRVLCGLGAGVKNKQAAPVSRSGFNFVSLKRQSNG